MNIFFLHRCPRRAARYAVDKHVVKMLLETCQLLYTCHHATGSTALHEAPFRTGTVERGYKKLNPNHPCGKWLRASSVHYLWLSTYGMALLAEYDHRYGSTKTTKTKTTKTKTTTPIKRHACAEHILWLHHNPPPFLQNYGWATPALAMPDIYKSGDPVASYRRYYLGDKQHILKWTGRHVPHWIPHWISPKVDSPQYIK